MSKFNGFRRKAEINGNCIAGYESSFIIEGTSAVVIHNERLDASQRAAIIITDKEGPDTSLVYTYKERALELELLKGDYYTWKNNRYLVYEDVQIVLDVNYKKQKSYQCNVTVECNNNMYGGYFVSSLARYVDTTLQSNLNITDNDKPVLVLPADNWVKIGAKIVVKNRPYKIIDIDDTTNDGIAYCSLSRDFMDKPVEQIEFTDQCPELIAGIEQEIKYSDKLEINPTVEIVSKTANRAIIVIPYGVNEVTINGTKYRVVV